MRIYQLTLAVLLLCAPAAAAQVVHGRVLDAATDAPVAGATVRVPETDEDAHARTDSLGRFRLVVDEDTVLRLEADAAGYRTSAATVPWPARRDSLEVVLRLSADTLLLEPLEIVAAGGRRTAQIERFYARAAEAAHGWFVTRAEIERQGAFRTTDLLRRARGIRLVQAPGGVVVRGRGGCVPAVYLDAVPISASLVDHWIRAEVLEGIEVYTTGMTPPEYQHRSNLCALVLLWTHHD